MSKFTTVAVIQNQAPFIVEWVAHHLAVGATDFVFCFYGSSDGTAKVIRRLSAMGYGAQVKIAVENDDPIASARAQVSGLEEVRDADLITVLDVSQFINIHHGFGSLKELAATFPDTSTAFALEVSRFGLNSDQDPLDGPITRNATQKDAQSDTETLVLARSLADLDAKEPTKIDPETAQVNRYIRDPQEIAPASTLTDESIHRYATWLEKYQSILMADRRLRLAHENGQGWHKAKQ